MKNLMIITVVMIFFLLGLVFLTRIDENDTIIPRKIITEEKYDDGKDDDFDIYKDLVPGVSSPVISSDEISIDELLKYVIR